jgi:hypothetical protein
VPDSCGGAPATIRLGGFVVYAVSEASLKRGLEELSHAILRGIQGHASLDRRLLLSVTAKEIGHRLDQRVFDAVLGSELRLGRIDRIPCASESGKVFRILVAAERLPEFNRRCNGVREWLQREGTVAVRDVRGRYFDGGWGTWWSAAHLLCRLVLVGCARYVDRYTFAWPEGLENAVR